MYRHEFSGSPFFTVDHHRTGEVSARVLRVADGYEVKLRDGEDYLPVTEVIFFDDAVVVYHDGPSVDNLKYVEFYNKDNEAIPLTVYEITSTILGDF